MSRSGEGITRRTMLGAGSLTGLATLGFSGAILAPAVTTDFGPGRYVTQVKQIGQHTHISLQFQVDGRRFSTDLKSIDGRVWRPA